MWNLKNDKMNLFTKQKQIHRHRKQTVVTKGERWRGGINWEFGIDKHTLRCVLSRLVMYASLQPHGSSVHGDFTGTNTGLGCHALLQGIFPTQGPNPGLPHCRRFLYRPSHQGSPNIYIVSSYLLARVTHRKGSVLVVLCNPVFPTWIISLLPNLMQR